MKRFLSFTLLILAATAVSLPAQSARDIGRIEVVNDSKTLAVRVSANTPELNALALQAFGTHGRYKLVASGFAFDIKFAAVTPTQVRVDITKSPSGTAVASEVVTGANARNALLKAADVAVAKTNGLGLRGYFASKLAFINERTGKKEIYTGDLMFGEVKQITRDNSIALSPRWAPDGSRLLYTSFYKSGFPDIFLIDLGSYQRSTFVSFKGTNSGARFSPTGSQVAMILSGEGNPEVYVSNAQGRGVSRKTRSDSAKSSPCFSPDGTRLVFSGEPGPQLYTMPVNGGAPTRLTSGISTYCAEPDWSRTNPNKIVFTMRGAGGKFQIAVYDFSKRASEQVSKAPFDGVEPSWLPDGRHVVYTARDRSTSRVCILDTETGKSTPISPSSFGSTLQANVWAQ